MLDIFKTIIAEIGAFLPDFLRFLAGPKRFLRERNSNLEANVSKSLNFLGFSFIIYAALRAPLTPNEARLFALLANFFILFLFVVVSSSLALWASWRLVGGRAPYERYLISVAYYTGAMIPLSTFLVFAVFGYIGLGSGRLYEALEVLRKGEGGQAFLAFLSDPAFIAATSLLLIGNALLLLWTFFFWGSFREMNGLSRARSAVAFCLTCILQLPIGFIAALIASLVKRKGGA